MIKNNRKVYKIWDNTNQIYLAYSRKRSWLVFPSQAIKYANLDIHNPNLEVHEFKLEPSWRYTLDKKLIHV